MSTKRNKASKRKGSPPFKRSYDYGEQNTEILRSLKKVVTESRAQTESTKEFQEEILRELDHTKSDLMEIGETNQLVIQRNNSILQLLDLLLLVVIFYG